MLVLDTIFDHPPWGGTKLLPLAPQAEENIGHLYSVYCREGISNRVKNGPLAGKTLNEVFPSFRGQVGMAALPYFPLTIALVDAREPLSIQVHPDDEAARALEGQRQGKRESWYFLNAPACGTIYSGCRAATE